MFVKILADKNASELGFSCNLFVVGRLWERKKFPSFYFAIYIISKGQHFGLGHNGGHIARSSGTPEK